MSATLLTPSSRQFIASFKMSFNTAASRVIENTDAANGRQERSEELDVPQGVFVSLKFIPYEMKKLKLK